MSIESPVRHHHNLDRLGHFVHGLASHIGRPDQSKTITAPHQHVERTSHLTLVPHVTDLTFQDFLYEEALDRLPATLTLVENRGVENKRRISRPVLALGAMTIAFAAIAGYSIFKLREAEDYIKQIAEKPNPAWAQPILTDSREASLRKLLAEQDFTNIAVRSDEEETEIEILEPLGVNLRNRPSTITGEIIGFVVKGQLVKVSAEEIVELDSETDKSAQKYWRLVSIPDFRTGEKVYMATADAKEENPCFGSSLTSVPIC